MTESEKFDNTSNCLTYEFKDDPNGVYLLELTGVFDDEKSKSRGYLFPDTSEPAIVNARFPLSE